jgi:hypothetical protein
MKLILVLLFFQFTICNSQVIAGRILDLSTDEPLEYVSIGVVNSPIGTITDEMGNFTMDVTGQSLQAMVRITIISYKEQTFTIEQFLKQANSIKMKPAPVQLPEIVIKPGKPFRAGVVNYTRRGHWCGWGGTQYSRGWEKGTKISLGNTPVQLLNFNIHMQRQSFDSSFYRLHIRSLVDNVPYDELLASNIIFKADKESGWVSVDLRKYNIILRGDIAVTIEWVKVHGVIKSRAMKFNGGLQTEYVLFNTKANQGPAYEKRSSQDKWRILDHHRPAIYLTVR